MEPLRPMSTGELLDRTFALYRRNFFLFVGIALVTHAFYFGYQLLTIHSVPIGRAARFGAAYYTSLGLGWVFLTIVLTISQAATVKAVAAVHLDQTTSVWAAYGALRRRIFTVFGVLIFILLIAGVLTAILFAFLAVAMGLVVAALRVGGGAPSATTSVVIGLVFISGVFFIFVGIYVRYALAIQACVVENLGAWASMKRSTALSKGGRWRIASVYVLFVILSVTASSVFAILARWAGTSIHNSTAKLILIDVSSLVSGALTSPLATIAMSLLYYDERVRKEAFDLHWMLATLEESVPAVPAAIQT